MAVESTGVSLATGSWTAGTGKAASICDSPFIVNAGVSAGALLDSVQALLSPLTSSDRLDSMLSRWAIGTLFSALREAVLSALCSG